VDFFAISTDGNVIFKAENLLLWKENKRKTYWIFKSMLEEYVTDFKDTGI